MDKKLKLKQLFGFFLKGFLMGSADVVPGVSGGTIAFITGIYDRLISAIAQVKLQEMLHGIGLIIFFWDKKKRELYWKTIAALDWFFLIPLALGIISAVLSFSQFIIWAKDSYPIWCFSIFSGLIIASIIFPWQKMKHGIIEYILLISTATAMFFLMSPDIQAANNDALLYLYFCGAIAICAMILPGISGSFILLMLGAYEPVLNAIHELDFTRIIVIGLGLFTGIFTFIHPLNYLLRHWHSATMAVLTGLMIGSLRVLWPFTEQNLLTQNTTFESSLPIGIGLAIFSAIAVLIMGFYEPLLKKLKSSS